MKLTDFGAAPPHLGLSKEDERSVQLAERAQRGDYDDGRLHAASRARADGQTSSSNS